MDPQKEGLISGLNRAAFQNDLVYQSNQSVSSSRTPLLSTGFYAFAFAQQFCSRVTVFGAVDAGYCDDVAHRLVPYHYYGKATGASLTICGHYAFADEKRRTKQRHRFLEERQVMKRMAESQGLPLVFVT